MRPFSLYFAPQEPIFTANQLYNCCPGALEPDWTWFSNLELGGCVDAAEPGSTDTAIEGGISRDDAHFFTIYGRLVEGGCEAITDCVGFLDAEIIALHLCETSKLTLEIVC